MGVSMKSEVLHKSPNPTIVYLQSGVTKMKMLVLLFPNLFPRDKVGEQGK